MDLSKLNVVLGWNYHPFSIYTFRLTQLDSVVWSYFFGAKEVNLVADNCYIYLLDEKDNLVGDVIPFSVDHFYKIDVYHSRSHPLALTRAFNAHWSRKLKLTQDLFYEIDKNLEVLQGDRFCIYIADKPISI